MNTKESDFDSLVEKTVIKYSSKENLKSYLSGHRKRVRKKFLASSSELFTDAELLEMLLYLAFPRQDTKPIAKEILADAKTLRSALLKTLERNQLKSKYGDAVFFILKLVHAVLLRSLITEIQETTVLASWSQLTNYLQLRFGGLTQEQFAVIFLNTKYELIEVAEFGFGTVDTSAVYVREIVKYGLSIGATNGVLVHNHPSGNAEPSSEDIKLAAKIKDACSIVNIKVLGHIIVTANTMYSFRNNNII